VLLNHTHCGPGVTVCFCGLKKPREGGRGMFARKPGKGITLEMYIRNIQVNKKILKKKKGEGGGGCLPGNWERE